MSSIEIFFMHRSTKISVMNITNIGTKYILVLNTDIVCCAFIKVLYFFYFYFRIKVELVFPYI